MKVKPTPPLSLLTFRASPPSKMKVKKSQVYFLLLPEKIHINRQPRSNDKYNSSNRIDHRIINIPAADLFREVGDERRRQVFLSQLFFHLPLPVGNRAITEAVPYAQYQPGNRRNDDAGKVPFARAIPYPSADVETYQQQVNDGEEYIKQLQHKAPLFASLRRHWWL